MQPTYVSTLSVLLIHNLINRSLSGVYWLMNWVLRMPNKPNWNRGLMAPYWSIGVSNPLSGRPLEGQMLNRLVNEVNQGFLPISFLWSPFFYPPLWIRYGKMLCYLLPSRIHYFICLIHPVNWNVYNSFLCYWRPWILVLKVRGTEVFLRNQWCMNNFGWTNMLQIHLQSFSVMNRQIVRYVDLFSKNPMKLKTYNYLSLQFLFNFVVITHP